MNINNIINIIKWLTWFTPSNKQSTYISVSREFLLRVKRWRETRGDVETIKMVKAIRLHYTRFLAGVPLTSSEHPALGINSRGLPRRVSCLERLLTEDVWDLRILMTLLNVSRTIPGWVKPDFTPITDPGTELPQSLLQEFDAFCQRRLSGISLSTDFERYRVTSKTGPIGLALDTAPAELALLLESGIAKAVVHLGGEQLKDKLNTVHALVEDYGTLNLTPLRGDKIRRLSVKKDTESKSRVFAMLDYWSQSSLQTLHEGLIGILRRIPSDCTFDQGSRLHKVKPNSQFHSIDLKNATDRFPIDLQLIILSVLIGADKARSWKTVMVSLPFHYEGKEYSYSRGQPMGALSSWPCFALAHHMVVQFSASRVGFPAYNNYMLLGDDIVIGDDAVSTEYQSVLRLLGVPTSPAKTHVSKDTLEFAKRWIHRGQEITGAPLQGLLSLAGPSSVLNFLDTLERNWSLPHETISRQRMLDLINAIQPGKDNRFFATRCFEAHLVPGKNIGDPRNSERLWVIYDKIMNKHMSCHVKHANLVSLLEQLIPMAKIALGQKAIIDTVKAANRYHQILIAKLKNSIFDEVMLSEIPQRLLALPAIEASRDFSVNAQGELDRMDTLIAECREEEILNDPPVIGFDPTKAMAADRSLIRFALHSKVPKVIRDMISKLRKLRRASKAWLNDGDESSPPPKPSDYE